MVDIDLESCKCISKAKRYNLVFKIAISSSKGSFPLVAFANSNLVVGVPKVNLGEDDKAIKVVQ